MSILTKIDNKPLFSSIKEAVSWGKEHGYDGYHTHRYQGQKGYMAGGNHNDIPNSSIIKDYINKKIYPDKIEAVINTASDGLVMDDTTEDTYTNSESSQQTSQQNGRRTRRPEGGRSTEGPSPEGPSEGGY